MTANGSSRLTVPVINLQGAWIQNVELFIFLVGVPVVDRTEAYERRQRHFLH